MPAARNGERREEREAAERERKSRPPGAIRRRKHYRPIEQRRQLL